MSPRSSKKSAGPAPNLDVYVALMFVAFAALIVGVTFLFLELNKYGWEMATQ